MAGYHTRQGTGFELFRSSSEPAWRAPQLAALGAVLGQWSLAGSDPPLVSIPTGVGKTAISLAAPFIAGATRTLVVVPTRELRRQTVEAFRTQAQLRQINALTDDGNAEPVVREAQGRIANWADLDAADVVVGLPASISPVHYEDDPPPRDLFDLVIIDEAHHAPAATWTAILEHFEARKLLLTATPSRRDRRQLPGSLVYYFPLRQALDDGLYKPVKPYVLEVPAGASMSDQDDLVLDKVVDLLGQHEHQSSQFIVRAKTKARAEQLAAKYEQAGHPIPVLHSGLGRARQQEIVDALNAGDHRGVAMVGMLVEGFDLPSLRILAYHDKHKSLEPTAQLIGRLARVAEAFPQDAALVTARDIDVYPHLEGTLRDLYAEDEDWANVLPGIIDDHVQDARSNASYARSFTTAPGSIDLAHVCPLRRALIFEISSPQLWTPTFAGGQVPAELTVGERFAGQRILYSGTNPTHTTLLVVTGERTRPRWNNGDELDSMEYDLHLLSFRKAPVVTQPDLLMVNSARVGGQKALLVAAGAKDVARLGDPLRMQEAFDSLQRISVSSIGIRSTYGAARGTPSYKMFAGSSIENGLRGSDTARAALGHAMAQVSGSGGAFVAGVSTGKGKYWETRYTPLRHYEEFIATMAGRYWSPVAATSGPLLPQVSRGRRLDSWPVAEVLAASLDYALLGNEWEIDGHGPLDFADVLAGAEAAAAGAPAPSAPDRISLAVQFPTDAGMVPVWTGEADLLGEVTTTGAASAARRGSANPVQLHILLTEHPLQIVFADGSTVRGAEYMPPTTFETTLPPNLVEPVTWHGVNIRAETKARALQLGAGMSIHEWLENYLIAQPKRGRRRWILCNDGSGEIADYIVLEMLPRGQIAVDLWHAKYADGNNPGTRITDFEVVSSQAVKSRRWPNDTLLWERLGRRLDQTEKPRLTIIEGSERVLRVLLGLETRWSSTQALANKKPAVISRIGIVQPGLSVAQLEAAAAAGTVNAVQIVQLLGSFRDAVMQVADAVVLASA